MHTHNLSGDHKERVTFARFALMIAIPVASACIAFAIGSVRAASVSETHWQEITPDIQKIRAMPEPSQVVTKDQFAEVVRRLDERTQQISQDVQFIRQHEEERSR